MEHMFREYSSWRTKLEQIESKMKQDVDFWKHSCEKMQRDTEKLQKEMLKTTQQLMERTKEVESKNALIDKLQKQAAANRQLDTVEEQLCSNCKNSLEESQIFSARMSNIGHHHNASTDSNAEMMVRDLTDRLNQLESQVLMYRERVAYHESVEDELKKNIEGQVDVVLKMEEERLLLIKETKEAKERERRVKEENEGMKERVKVFERELEELQVQIKE